MPTTWADGDYPAMARRLEPAAERVVARAQIVAGERVLDVGCGTGNAALLAAMHGAMVEGIDSEPALLAIAGQRAREAGLRVHWHRGEAQALDAADGEYTVVLSVFGAMYAADHEAAARELRRVCAADGRVVLAAWRPGSFMARMGAVLAPYLPDPPPGSGPPSRWGDEQALSTLLGGAGLTVADATRETLTLAFDSRQAATTFLVETAGHVVAERRRLQAEGRWADLLADLSVLVAESDAGGPDGGAALELDYLLAVARPA